MYIIIKALFTLKIERWKIKWEPLSKYSREVVIVYREIQYNIEID